MGKFRQVSKEEYDVLRKFGVPVEIRYYASTGKDKKGPQPKKKRPVSGTGKGPNQPIHLSGHKHEFPPGSMYGKMHRSMLEILDSDPTQIIGRTELRDLIMEHTKVEVHQAASFVSQSIRIYKTLKLKE